MRVVIALGYDPKEPKDAPRVLSSYDEYTAEDWGGEPGFFQGEIQKATWTDGLIVRQVTVKIPDGAIAALFAMDTTVIPVEVI